MTPNTWNNRTFYYNFTFVPNVQINHLKLCKTLKIKQIQNHILRLLTWWESMKPATYRWAGTFQCMTYKHRGEPRQAVGILGQEGHTQLWTAGWNYPGVTKTNSTVQTQLLHRSHVNKRKNSNQTKKHLGGPGEGLDAHWLVKALMMSQRLEVLLAAGAF